MPVLPAAVRTRILGLLMGYSSCLMSGEMSYFLPPHLISLLIAAKAVSQQRRGQNFTSFIAKFAPLVSRAEAVPPQGRHPVGANAPSSAGARGLKSAGPRARSGQRRCSDRGPLLRR